MMADNRKDRFQTIMAAIAVLATTFAGFGFAFLLLLGMYLEGVGVLVGCYALAFGTKYWSLDAERKSKQSSKPLRIKIGRDFWVGSTSSVLGILLFGLAGLGVGGEDNIFLVGIGLILTWYGFIIFQDSIQIAK